MPLKLVPPRKGKTSFWSVRGTHLGTYLDRSTKAADRITAAKQLRIWKDEIERGALAKPGEPTFLDAAVVYMADTGNERFLPPVLEHFGKWRLGEITQQAIDAAAIHLYPRATPATRNRQVHTVVSAVLKHAGIDDKLRRPKGWRGTARTRWLQPEAAFALLAAGRQVDHEFGILLVTLLYTGLRLSEALALRCDQVEIERSYAYLETTKNNEPRAIFLPPRVTAALLMHPRGIKRRMKDGRSEKLFRFFKGGRLYSLMARAKKAAGPEVQQCTFHTLRHTWATWMRRHGGLDVHGLVATGAWKDPASAARYAHVEVSEESRRAILLPTEASTKRSGS